MISYLIQSIGRCLERSQNFKEQIIPILLHLLQSENREILSESLIQMKLLVQHDPQISKKVISSIQSMDWMDIKSIESRACIIWLFGEFHQALRNQAPDILRVLLINFTQEDILVKYQILNFAAKLFAQKGNESVVGLLFQYVCNLSAFDSSYDLRDRCRTLKALLSNNGSPTLRQYALPLVRCPKPSPIISVSFDPDLFLGSLSHCMNRAVENYCELKPWNEKIDPVGVSARNIKSTKQEVKRNFFFSKTFDMKLIFF